MKTFYKTWLVLFVASMMFNCSETEEITNNNERRILAVGIDGQVGTPNIPGALDENAATTITTFKELDFSNLALDIVVSPGATVSPESGQAVDFASNGNKYIYTVTSESGLSKDWEITVDKYVNPVGGTWRIEKLEFYWDDWFGWGNSGVLPLADKLPQSAPGVDDIITFSAIELVDDAGIVYGSYTRTTGADGQSAGFINEATGKDYSDKFNRITGPAGKWQINADGTVTFTDSNNAVTTAKSIETIDENTILIKLDPGPQTWEIDWGDYFGNPENALNFAWDVLYTLKRQ